MEILIAFAIMVLSITAVILLVFGSQSISIDTQTNTEALSRAQALIEQARAQALNGFTSVVSGSTTEVVGGLTYKKDLTVSDTADPDVKNVTGTVSWVAGSRSLSVSLATLITNPLGNRCNQTLAGDWSAPQIYGYVDFPSPKGASGIDIENGTAYISTDPSSPGTDDFYSVDVSGAGPGVGSLPTRGHFSTSYGLTAIKTVGNYSYVTADSTAYQLLVIDVSDPDHLDPGKIKAKVDVTAPGDSAVGNTLLYKNQRIYLGLTKSSGPEFYIIDVSNPLSPQVKGSYEVGSAVNNIVLKGGIAYLATASSTEILALNVQNPNTPTFVAKYSSATLTGQSLAFDQNSTLYFGRSGSGNPALLAFDPSDLSSPQWTFDTTGSVYTIIPRGKYLFITVNEPTGGLQIYDVSGPSPVRIDTSPVNLQQVANAGSDCYAELVYVAQRSNRAMQVVGPYVPFSYSLAASNDIALQQGNTGSTTIALSLLSGISQSVTLKATGLPSGATASFNPNSCGPSCSSILTIITSLTTPPGTYTITVTGTGGVTTTFKLIISAAPFSYSLSNSGNINVKQGSNGAVTVNATLLSGTTQQVNFSTSSLPTLPGSVKITQDKNFCSPTCTMTLTISPATDPATKNKSYLITITGTSAGQPNKTTSFTLTVKP